MLSEEEKRAMNNLNFIVVTDIYDNEVSINKTKMINEYNHSVGIVLNLITKLQKENEELKQENKRIKYFSSNLFIGDYIPKQVVKDKIKEIEEDKECYYYDWFLEELDIEKTINILEKILGE